MHQQLKLAGYDGWFDKVNIPDGDDYAQRINQGIESAQFYNFPEQNIQTTQDVLNRSHELIGKTD